MFVNGGGGVGGYVGLHLAKMQIKNLCICDDKIVAAHNPPNQIFGGARHMFLAIMGTFELPKHGNETGYEVFSAIENEIDAFAAA